MAAPCAGDGARAQGEEEAACLGDADAGIPDSSVLASAEPLQSDAPRASACLEFGTAGGRAVGLMPSVSREEHGLGDGPGCPAGPPDADPEGDLMRVAVLKVVAPLRICTWNSQALLRSLFSRAGRITEKRLVLQRLLASSDVVFLQEVHGTLADLEVLPPTHLYYASFGEYGSEEASSRWGGVVVAVSKSLAQRAAVRGRTLQVDVVMLSGRLRFLCLHADPSLSLRGLQGAFALMSRCWQDEAALTMVAGEFNLISRDDARFQSGGGVGGRGDGTRGEVVEDAVSGLLLPTQTSREGSARKIGERSTRWTMSGVQGERSRLGQRQVGEITVDYGVAGAAHVRRGLQHQAITGVEGGRNMQDRERQHRRESRREEGHNAH